MREWLKSPEGQTDIAKVKELSIYAENGEYLWHAFRTRIDIRCETPQNSAARSSTLRLRGSARNSTPLPSS